MTRIDKAKIREIVDDFALEIERCKRPGPKPQKTVIYFRDERKYGIEREVFDVPIELLRYRKDNGRIRADVISYEKEFGVLNEKSKESQEELRKMLDKNDPEKNEELERSISHEGQRDPAIITCDGFLINGNRRKMILERINNKKPGSVKSMKVVILPGKKDPGGPPTLVEIEEIENRYQQQSEGKAEYTKFNTALSIQRKIDMGMTLERQLRDDPIYAGLDAKEFRKALKTFQEEYLKPLECIDRYLETLGREGLYNTIASGTGDREGRWQAFLDYYSHVCKKIYDEKQRLALGIKETEVGEVEDIAFKIIRKREFKGLGKAHMIIRDLPKWIGNPESKKELFKIAEIPHDLDDHETIDDDEKEQNESTKDKIWAAKHQTDLFRQIKRAKQSFEEAKTKETPLELLEQALKKLRHNDMVIDAIQRKDISKAKTFIHEIRMTLDTLDAELFVYQKNR
jgi:hypothetical protein